MHRVAYVHRDIKLENLLFAGENCEPETLRIADFGFARKMTSSRSTLSEQCGTPGYVAPEIITGQCYTPAVDCWAAGVVLYAAVVGRFPFDAGEDTQASFRMIAEGRVHEIPASSGVSDDAKDLIARLLTVDPVTRFTAEEALGHPWIVKHTSSANDGGDGGGADGYARAVVAPGQRMRRAMQSKLGSDLKLREYPPGAYLTRLGERAKASNEEVYLIKGGVGSSRDGSLDDDELELLSPMAVAGESLLNDVLDEAAAAAAATATTTSDENASPASVTEDGSNKEENKEPFGMNPKDLVKKRSKEVLGRLVGAREGAALRRVTFDADSVSLASYLASSSAAGMREKGVQTMKRVLKDLWSVRRAELTKRGVIEEDDARRAKGETGSHTTPFAW
jgi:protein serine kinase H